MTLYLILHKVRGLPAFDIADRCDEMGTEDDPGPWWIVPTSGHRAYPYRSWALDNLVDVSDINKHGFHDTPATFDFIPIDWPDHYATGEAKPSTGPSELLARLGLVKPISESVRRI